MANRKGIRAGRAYVEAWLDDSAVARGLKRLRKRFDSFSAGLANIGTKLLGTGLAAGSLFAAPLKRAAEMEQVAAGFESLTGSAEAAAKVMAEIRKFGVETPFEFPELADASRKLMAFGVSATELIPTLRAIGDVSSAIGAPIGEIAEIYGKAKVQGRLFAQDINQLTGRGIPVIDELAKQFGVTKEEVRGLVESGKVDFANLEAAFRSLSGQGGKFFGMMDRQSRTLIGRLSTLKDAFWEAITPIGTALLPQAGKLLTVASSLVSTLGAWIKANAKLAVKAAALAAALVVLGSGALALSVALRAASLAIGGLGLAMRVVLLPATIAVTAATRTAAAVTATMTGATKALRATTLALSATLRSLSLVATATQYTLAALVAALVIFRRGATALAVTLRLAVAATALFNLAIRAAQGAVFLFSGSLRLLGASLALVSAILAAFGSPAGAALVAIAALGAALYLAMQNSSRFGDVLTWLKDRFGPLAKAVVDVVRVMSDALMAGELSAAVKVLWAAIQLAFAQGSQWVQSAWVDMTASLASAFIDLAAQIESVWARMSAAIVQGVISAGQKALGFAATIAEKLGRTGEALQLRMLAIGLTAGGVVAEAGSQGRQAEIEAQRKAVQATLEEDAARRRAMIDAGVTEAADELSAAMAAAKTATAEATQAQQAAAPAAADATPPAARGISPAMSAKPAINTAAIVGTKEGQDALFKALGGSIKGVTPGDRLVALAIDRLNAAEARRHRESLKNGGTLKVEKAT
jgi:tape measure domain-containing protein